MAAEHDLIARYFAPLAGPEGHGLLDDAASVDPPAGFDLVVTTDLVAEGIHFLDDPPGAIAAKALRVNLSDLAAKGARPYAYSLALGLGPEKDERWIAAFAEGLAADQKTYDVRLIGGDTSRLSTGVVVTITAFGWVPTAGAVLRSTARPGDVLMVSGTIGDAALGLLVRKGATLHLEDKADCDFLLQRYLYPEPRVGLANGVRRFASAAMDISDGLAGDLGKLCLASGVGAEITVADIPLSDAARRASLADSDLVPLIHTGGDDYEILLAASPDNAIVVAEAARLAHVPLTPIGRIVAGSDVIFRRFDGTRMSFGATAYDHFSVARTD